MIEILRGLHRLGATVCMVTHDPRYAGYAETPGRNSFSDCSYGARATPRSVMMAVT